jgi:GTP-binding protein LepA
MMQLHNPADMPDPVKVERIEEPWIKATILVPDEYLGGILALCTERRGVQIDLTYAGNRAMLVYRLPLNEVVFDFYDRLKSISRGYASFDYQIDGYEEGDLVVMNILVNNEPVDALAPSCIAARPSIAAGRWCERLKDLIPPQLFQIAIQAAIGAQGDRARHHRARQKEGDAQGRAWPRCYGGDISRKRKLLDKQKEGKKRMRQFGEGRNPAIRLRRRTRPRSPIGWSAPAPSCWAKPACSTAGMSRPIGRTRRRWRINSRRRGSIWIGSICATAPW